MTLNRAEKGERHWQRVFGTSSDEVATAFDDIAPGFGTHIRDFAFGDIMDNDVLSPRDRQIATVAALSALATAPKQLAVHMRGALHAGCSREEIVEIVKQMAIYAGFPAAINALNVARDVFKDAEAQ